MTARCTVRHAAINPLSVSSRLRRGSGGGSSSGRASAFAADFHNPLIVSRIGWIFLVCRLENPSHRLGLVSLALSFGVAGARAVAHIAFQLFLLLLPVLLEDAPVLIRHLRLFVCGVSACV